MVPVTLICPNHAPLAPAGIGDLFELAFPALPGAAQVQLPNAATPAVLH